MKKYIRPTVGSKENQEAISRIIMSKKLGRLLLSEEIVHHINGDPKDNREENLLLVNRAEHKKIHSEIGLSTRFKRIYFFNDSKILKDYHKYHSATRIAEKEGCHVITVERYLRKILKVKRLKAYKKEKGGFSNE
jgi:HNH endonuclease